MARFYIRPLASGGFKLDFLILEFWDSQVGQQSGLRIFMFGKKMQTRMNGLRRFWVVAILLCSSCSGKSHLIGCSTAGDQGASTHPASFSLPIVHKYSQKGRELLMKARGLPPVGDNKLPATAIAEWPLEETREYYDMLRRHDHARLHGGRRQLLAGNTVYTFAAGNESEQLFLE